MGAIYRREIGAFFTSSIAYVFLAVFYSITGFMLSMENLAGGATNLMTVFTTMFIISIFMIPVLTMRLFSEEKKQRTEQGLLTAPVSLTGIVLGKYFAALTIYVIAAAVVFFYGVLLSLFGTVAWMTLLSNFIAIVLVGAAFIGCRRHCLPADVPARGHAGEPYSGSVAPEAAHLSELLHKIL